MKVTRVIIKPTKTGDRILAHCAVVLDDALRLDSIELRESEETGMYLTLPSKQGIYKEIISLNHGTQVNLPRNRRTVNSNPNRKHFEEFYYPVDSSFYKELLNEIVTAYKNCGSDET